MSSTFELFVFDWDGTLMDSVDHIVASLSAAAADTDMVDLGHQRYRDIIGLGLAEAMHALYPDATEDDTTRLCERYRHHFLDKNKAQSALFEGTHEMLCGLKEKDIKIAVATGKARIGLDRVFEETGYGDMFHASRCADESGSKPKPHMLHELMSELGVSPENTVMIGDTTYDMQMASNAGTAGLAVSYGVHNCEQLLKHNPLACCNNVNELSRWLHSHS